MIEPLFTEIIIPEQQPEQPNDTIYISMNDPKTGKQIGRTESRWCGHWHLGDIWVDPDYRRNRLGTRLLNETCFRLWNKERAKITADAVPYERDCTLTQEELNTFYKKAGFSATNIEKRFKRMPPSV